MTFSNFDPKKTIIGFKGDLDRLFDDFFGFDAGEELNKGEVSPKVSIEDKEREYVVSFELAGLSKDDVKVTFQNEKLYVAGEKKADPEETKYYKNERKFGTIARAIKLPAKIASENISAIFENGLLRVTLQKQEEAVDPGIEVNIK
jgi:HSP20 family protein